MIAVQVFDPAQHDAVEVATLHLWVRRQQEADGEQAWADIYDSQDELRDAARAYAAPSRLFVACSGDYIRGLLGVQVQSDRAMLKRMAVHWDFRDMRIGSRLVQAALAYTDELGLPVELTTGAREKARGVYERQGFVVVGEASEQGASALPDLVMRRPAMMAA